MRRRTLLGRLCLLSGLVVLALTFEAPSQTRTQPRPAQAPAPRRTPRLEAVAETKLLMEGLTQSNFRGLERLLKKKPTQIEEWVFARGQALLIAETGNLLLLRPPKTAAGQDTWQQRAMELRDAATALARTAAARDFEKSRTALEGVANVCNRCHQSFRVPVKITPFADATKDRAVRN